MKSLIEAFNKRRKNYVFWAALLSLIGTVGTLYFTGYFNEDKWVTLTPVVLSFLVAAGVCNDPTTGKGLSDTPSVEDSVDVKKE